jgi:hypothetical protein
MALPNVTQKECPGFSAIAMAMLRKRVKDYVGVNIDGLRHVGF